MANLLLSSSLTADQRDLAETLCQSSEALLTIINDILDFSKIEAGRLVLESIDFNLLEHLELALDLHADAAARKSLELVMHIDPAVPHCVRGDPVRLRQVVLNLVSNAIKFTAKGEVLLRVSVEAQDEDSTRLRFDILDTGIGIPSDVQALLFQPFVQADSTTTRRFGGSGLGLAICKRLVELMHGQIGVESVAGEGSNFWFTAEVESALENLPPQLLTPSLLENHRALIVDDNSTNRKLLTHLCEAWQLPHEATADAHAALEALRRAAAESDPFDIVILDHHMPDIDGLGLAALVREDLNLPQPKLVLLTSRGERFNRSEMVAHSLAACELKPLHPQRLRNTLSRVLATPTLTSGKVNTTPPIPVQAPVESQPGALPVLIAEDNIVNQKVTLLQLRKLGYTGEVVHNGRQAVEAVQKKRYALVLMDAQMPELDGISATREIRAAQAAGQPGFPEKLRIIAMTANAMTGDREMCLDAGMDDYLSKPVTPDALRGILERYAVRETQANENLPACTLAS